MTLMRSVGEVCRADGLRTAILKIDTDRQAYSAKKTALYTVNTVEELQDVYVKAEATTCAGGVAFLVTSPALLEQFEHFEAINRLQLQIDETTVRNRNHCPLPDALSWQSLEFVFEGKCFTEHCLGRLS